MFLFRFGHRVIQKLKRAPGKLKRILARIRKTGLATNSLSDSDTVLALPAAAKATETEDRPVVPASDQAESASVSTNIEGNDNRTTSIQKSNLTVGGDMIIHAPPSPSPSPQKLEVKVDLQGLFEDESFERFIGREEEIAWLKSMFIDQAPVSRDAVVLFGKPGVGKSALAFAFARLYEDSFDAVYGVRVDGEKGDAHAIAKHLATLIPQEINEQASASNIIRELFGSRRVLLIFDNAETTEVRKLLPGDCRYAAIVTTQNRALVSQLNVDEARCLGVNAFNTDQGLDLLSQWAPEAVRLELDTAKRLVDWVGGLPLALQAIGAGIGGKIGLAKLREV